MCINQDISEGGKQAFEDWDRELKARRWRYWAALQNAHKEYNRVNGTSVPSNDHGFFYFMQRTYGIKPGLTHSGQISEHFEVVDDSLYTYFVLKYFK